TLTNTGNVTLKNNAPFTNSAAASFSISTSADGMGNGEILISGSVTAGTINLRSTSNGSGNGGIQNLGVGGTLTANVVNLGDSGSSLAFGAQNLGSTS